MHEIQTTYSIFIKRKKRLVKMAEVSTNSKTFLRLLKLWYFLRYGKIALIKIKPTLNGG